MSANRILKASTNGTYGNVQGWEAVGYEDTHNSIDGFPCFHEFQIGGLAFMPVTGEVMTFPGRLENPEEGWRSIFDKSDEIARLRLRPGRGPGAGAARSICQTSMQAGEPLQSRPRAIPPKPFTSVEPPSTAGRLWPTSS